ncbi:MAG: GNAT family N-acetyltransferase [Nitrospira sp.]|nr:GNAT family N-acetyltransferase [Nitrospira sp.]ULA60842.1 MAG: GNAT family N-acetyltransferase [Nitrospira sp.]
MPKPTDFLTPRLTLRQWRASDLEPFAAMNADADVMRYYPAMWTREQSDGFAERVRQLIEERGWGFWAVEERPSGQFIGFVGLHTPSNELPFAPCVEVGWRLAKRYWGLGYATEAAQSAIAFGFQHLHLGELVAFTAIDNLKSRAVMERLGMRLACEFDHPQVPAESELRRHVLYRLSQSR